MKQENRLFVMALLMILLSPISILMALNYSNQYLDSSIDTDSIDNNPVQWNATLPPGTGYHLDLIFRIFDCDNAKFSLLVEIVVDSDSIYEDDRSTSLLFCDEYGTGPSISIDVKIKSSVNERVLQIYAFYYAGTSNSSRTIIRVIPDSDLEMKSNILLAIGGICFVGAIVTYIIMVRLESIEK